MEVCVTDSAHIEEQLLRALRRQQYWRLHDLADAVQQPLDFVKEKIGKFALRVGQGEHKAKYELKGEFRLSSSASSLAANTSTSSTI